MADRTPIEELHFRIEQIQKVNSDWEVHSLDEEHLEALLVKRDTYAPYHALLSPDQRNQPKRREMWRRFWIDERGHWHSQRITDPAAGPGRGRRGPNATSMSVVAQLDSDAAVSTSAEETWRRITRASR